MTQQDRIRDLIAGNIASLIDDCPGCGRRGRLVIVNDEHGPVDAVCGDCAATPLFDVDPLFNIATRRLRSPQSPRPQPPQ